MAVCLESQVLLPFSCAVPKTLFGVINLNFFYCLVRLRVSLIGQLALIIVILLILQQRGFKIGCILTNYHFIVGLLLFCVCSFWKLVQNWGIHTVRLLLLKMLLLMAGYVHLQALIELS